MKRLVLALIFLAATLLNAEDNSEKLLRIDRMIKEIKESKARFNAIKLQKIPDPFYKKRATATSPSSKESNLSFISQPPEAELILFAIIGNQAKINDRWYRAGDTVEGYKLDALLGDRVRLLKGGISREINLVMPDSRIQIQTMTIKNVP